MAAVSKFVDIPVIVGGGIRTPEQAAMMIKAGAKVVVQGTKYEEYLVRGEMDKIRNSVKATIDAMRSIKR